MKIPTRELECLKLVTQGHSNKEIANLMHIAIKTVEKHRQMAFWRLSVDSPIALARAAIRAGVITANEFMDSKVGENTSHKYPQHRTENRLTPVL